MNPTNILPIIIANNANHVHSEAGAIALLVGFAVVALFVIIVAIRWTILDLVDNRARARREMVYRAMKDENDPRYANDWQLFRAELERRLAKNAK
jgi:hypothetical protein